MRLSVPGVIICLGLGGLAAGQTPTPLPQLVAEALHKSPRIQAAELAWQAARQAVAPAGALPDPEVEVQQMSAGSPLPLAGFATSTMPYIGVGVAQALPYPGKLGLHAAVARSHAAAMRAQLDQARRELTAEVQDAWIHLAYVAASLRVIEQQRALLAQAEQLAEVHYRAGQGPQADVLAAQLAQTQLLRDLATFRQQQQTAQAQLGALLNRAPAAAPIIPGALAETRLRQSDAQVLAALPNADPALAAQQARIQGAARAVALAQRNFLPDFNLQYMYLHTGSAFPDRYMWTVGATLPIFHRRSRRQPELAQAAAAHASAQATYQDMAQQQRFAATDALLALHSDEQILTIDQQGLLPQAQAGTEAALTAYGSGREDLGSFLSAWREQLGIQEQYWHTLADHEDALAQIQALTGVGHD